MFAPRNWMVCLASFRSCAVHRPHPPTLLWLWLCKSRAVISTSSLRHFSKQNSKISKIWLCVKSIGSTGCSNLRSQSERPGREFFVSREPPHLDSLGRFKCPPSDQKTTFFFILRGGRKIEHLFHRKVQGIPILETLLTPTTSLASCHWLDLATIRI